MIFWLGFISGFVCTALIIGGGLVWTLRSRDDWGPRF
jgi:hypothetical protein